MQEIRLTNTLGTCLCSFVKKRKERQRGGDTMRQMGRRERNTEYWKMKVMKKEKRWKDRGRDVGEETRQGGSTKCRGSIKKDGRELIRQVFYILFSVWQVLIAIMITQIAPLGAHIHIPHQNTHEVVGENFNVLSVTLIFTSPPLQAFTASPIFSFYPFISVSFLHLLCSLSPSLLFHLVRPLPPPSPVLSSFQKLIYNQL